MIALVGTVLQAPDPRPRAASELARGVMTGGSTARARAAADHARVGRQSELAARRGGGPAVDRRSVGARSRRHTGSRRARSPRRLGGRSFRRSRAPPASRRFTCPAAVDPRLAGSVTDATARGCLGDRSHRAAGSPRWPASAVTPGDWSMIAPSMTTLSPFLDAVEDLNDAQIGWSDLDQAHLVRAVRHCHDDVTTGNPGRALAGDEIARAARWSECRRGCRTCVTPARARSWRAWRRSASARRSAESAAWIVTSPFMPGISRPSLLLILTSTGKNVTPCVTTACGSTFSTTPSNVRSGNASTLHAAPAHRAARSPSRLRRSSRACGRCEVGHRHEGGATVRRLRRRDELTVR